MGMEEMLCTIEIPQCYDLGSEQPTFPNLIKDQVRFLGILCHT